MRFPRTHATMLSSLLCIVLAAAGACCGAAQTRGGAPRAAACSAYTQGTWAPVAPMNERRDLPAMVVLSDGRVLVSGGATEAYEPLVSAEIYSPATDTWTPTGAMARPRFGHKLVLLPDKKVLAVGGGPGEAEVYDPVTGAWSDLSGASGRSGTVAASLPDGRVAVVGGRTDTVEHWGVLPQPTEQFDLFDPATRSWRRGPSLDSVREGAAGAIAPDGSILVVGGNYYVPPLIRISFWDPASGATKASRGMLLWRPGAKTWTHVPWPRSAGGRGAGAASVGGHEVLVLAGSGDGISSRHVAVVDTRTASLRRASPMHVARHYAVPIGLGNGCVMVLGGARPGDPAEVYSSVDDVWATMPGTPIESFVAALLADGSVLVLGDRDHARHVYRYRPVP